MTHDNAQTNAAEWAIVELMGHRRRAGMAQEVEKFGGKLLRIDIPVDGDLLNPASFVTEFYGGSAIYAFRPVSEDVAREAAKQIGDPRPVRPVDYRLADQRDGVDSDNDWSSE